MKSINGLLDNQIEVFEKKKLWLEEKKSKWLEDSLTEPLILQYHYLEIERLKLSILLCKTTGRNFVLFEKIRNKIIENCVKQQEIFESLSENKLIDDGTYLILCNENKKTHDIYIYE